MTAARAKVLPISSSQSSRHSSASPEWNTPTEIIEAARTVLGDIDLDPASSKEANWRVRAAEFYTKKENGFPKLWHGNVFLNPPGGWCDLQGREVQKASKGAPPCTVSGACGLPKGHAHEGCLSSQKLWWQRLATEWQSRRVDAAIFVCFSVELLQSTQCDPFGALPLEFPICYPKERVRYVNAQGEVGGSPPHASCIVYLPNEGVDARAGVSLFRETFGPIGKVVVPDAQTMRGAP